MPMSQKPSSRWLGPDLAGGKCISPAVFRACVSFDDRILCEQRGDVDDIASSL
jgi:hypothetical protein